MQQRHLIRLAFIVLAMFYLVQTSVAQQQLSRGQSTTFLPDGSALLLGGYDSAGQPITDASLATSSGKPTIKLDSGLIIARAGQTATVLPDGTVFIFGGVGQDGKLVASPESYDPVTSHFSLVTDVFAVPRAFHTATLLTDGTILLAGGTTSGGQFSEDIQLVNVRTKKVLSEHAALSIPRQCHTATLLADGTVRISGGTDHFGRPVKVDEIFDPLTKRFRLANSADANVEGDQNNIAESIPSDGATSADISSPIAVRFGRLIDEVTANRNNFVLLGPGENVIASQVSAAEHGRLAFIVPSSPLQPGTTYTLRVTGVVDSGGSGMLDTSITFQTAGAPPDPVGLDWVPNTNWMAGGSITRFQELPALHGQHGVTALAGQVLKLNGWPLEHVTLEIDKKRTQTDSTGRFLLQGLTPGHHVLWIDASSASRLGAVYGVYETGVDVLAAKTNVLNYTIWMTRLDMANAVNIASPTKSEIVISSPYMPGLELHLASKTVITDRDGKPVHQVSITPVPLDKPPFPLPAGVQVPIYFTVQPGGAYIEVLNAGTSSQGARLIYPNAFHQPPGTVFDFWNYDADIKGWYVYGHGQVSPDGTKVVPDPGTMIYEFTGAMVAGATNAKAQGGPGGSGALAGDPVNLSTGQFVYTKTDLAISDTFPIDFTRTYTTNDNISRSLGIGAMDSYDIIMVGDTHPYTYQELMLPDGSRIRFDRISPVNGLTDFGNAVYTHTTSNTRFYGALLSWNNDTSLPGSWILRLMDGTTYNFPDSEFTSVVACQAVLQIQDRYGNKLKIDRAPGSCVLTKITSPNGRYINFTSDTQSRITQATDNLGRTVQYAYDTAGRLSTVTDTAGGVTTYTYDSQNRMLSIKDARNIVYLTNQYDSAGRVTQQTQADGGTFLFNWTAANASQTHYYRSEGTGGGGGGNSVLLANGCWTASGFNRYDSSDCGEGYMPLVAQVDVTDPRGYIRRVVFNSSGYVTTDTHALGQPEQQTIAYDYYADNLPKSVTDSLGRVSTFDYDRYGNTTRITRLDGTPDAVTTTFSYSGALDQLSSITDPLNHTSAFSYDVEGDLITATDALGHATTFGYNGNGQLTSATDPLNNAVHFSYFGGDLASVSDPLGNFSTQFTDAAGRVISATDAQGNLTQYQYSPLNIVTQVTDPKGNNTTFSYDANGNLLSLTDAASHTTSYTYDNMDRVQTRVDPLLRQESYSYDLNGNLVSSTDRKSQVTSLTYDPLNRLKLVGFNTVTSGGVTSYESTTGYTYDAGNRMTQAVDSAGGTITEAYDNLDRLTSETTPQGQISYGYDLAGRRTSMTVAGQPQVTYSYDNANRLTQIAQGTSTVGFSFDNASRRSTLTLSNGVNMAYTYDNDGRVTGITYKFNAATLGNLAYSYDSLSRRTLVSGSLAQTSLPGAVTSTTYDAANELTNWNGAAISYDLNGNMLSDGTNAFTWNARNQVATLNSVSLQYDAAGRRTKNLQNTSFLFDGANAVQELSGSTPIANLINGGIDEIFSRADSTGSFTPLKDALGSTIALVDASGNLATSYAYDPFGNTTVSGAANSNLFQYTGRENEGNGLYYYRARYYSPVLGRFINEDPLGLGGRDINFYAYVGADPINFVDPDGTDALPTAAGLLSAGWQLLRGGAGSQIVKLVAGGSAEGAGGGPVGALVGIGALAVGGIIDARSQYNAAINNEDAAYAAEYAIIGKSNAAMLAHPPSPLLSGRYTGKKRRKWNDDDCEIMFESDVTFCNSLPYQNRAACRAQAYERYANCLAGRPIPPFPWRLPN
jgi:RHS repeat-associated protein